MPCGRVGSMWSPYAHHDNRAYKTQRSAVKKENLLVRCNGPCLVHALNQPGEGGAFIDMNGTVTIPNPSVCLKTYCESMALYDPVKGEPICFIFNAKFKNMKPVACIAEPNILDGEKATAVRKHRGTFEEIAGYYERNYRDQATQWGNKFECPCCKRMWYQGFYVCVFCLAIVIYRNPATGEEFSLILFSFLNRALVRANTSPATPRLLW